MSGGGTFRPGLPACLALLVLSGCNQTDGASEQGPANGSATVAKHYEGPKPEGVSRPDEAVTTTFYIPQAAIGDMYEMEAGKIAMVRARAPEVKAFARMMVADHQRSSDRLRRFVADNPVNIAIPQNIDARRRAMLGQLNGAGDQEFDSVYVGQQAAAHLEAFNLQSSYARRGDYPALRKMAGEMVPVIAAHRKQAEALDARFGPTARSVPAGQ
ncbi:DUF4142 domain-containing protein [Sphingobium indicum]|uniref:DUF4142 domain-containing protein n=2 Tax=Sphingobium indicum TaxID=332055 RepID=A0A1L5BP51_SPHIB|nr:DUF4142 domain-containing protein [Sphingobium indicum]APL94588.1 hypothetical protein SIDU_08780 [Sphingobium indicum B90A]KEY97638.1 membrane protein [Sphingomonas sp. BHC-A]NYI23275.1 putative membrane protein [Sphingobium indicum]RYM04338.1 DUF4142 domain-containing protein [Sphingobium indicum]